MSHEQPLSYCPPNSQRGFVLLVALILLLLLTLLGLTAAKSTMMEERMAGNERNHQLAFESAEAGLSAAYSGLLQNLWSNADFAGNANGLYTLSDCCSGSQWTSAWTLPNVWNTAIPITTPVPGLNVPGQLTQQPVFIIEKLPPVAPPGTNLAQQSTTGTPPVQPYRITVYATGGDQTTHVVLQTVVTP